MENMGGKYADINSLFVGLARACGIPAREMYGIRVADSRQFKSLGKHDGISKAQHCRAEYFSPRYGWVPVDPKIKSLRAHLFGNWEMNWVSFNDARDFVLAPKARQALPYLMYPYAEFGDTVLDGRNPGDFNFNSEALTV